jgi:hypothetical protein
MSSAITPMLAIATRGPTAGSPKTISPSPEDFITRSQALNVWNAADYAREHLKKPLNTYIVIAFSEAKDWVKGRRTDAQHRAVRNRFTKVLRDWHRHNELEFIAVSADENPLLGGPRPHINILLHLPEDRYADLRTKLFKCLQKAGGWDDTYCPDVPPCGWKRRGLVIEPELGRKPKDRRNSENLGSGLIFHSQNKTVAAMTIAAMKMSAQRQ